MILEKPPLFTATIKQGRLNLTLEAFYVGSDLQLILHGGLAHIGAVALAEPGGKTSVTASAGHRESELARTIASTLCAVSGRRVAASCGIHFDKIKPEEIVWIENAANELAQKFINAYLAGVTC